MNASGLAIIAMSVIALQLLQDRYAYGHTTPSIDASQDWVLTGGNEEGGLTTLQFERKLDTCDPDDIAINFVSYILIISGTIIIVYIHLKIVCNYISPAIHIYS